MKSLALVVSLISYGTLCSASCLDIARAEHFGGLFEVALISLLDAEGKSIDIDEPHWRTHFPTDLSGRLSDQKKDRIVIRYFCEDDDDIENLRVQVQKWILAHNVIIDVAKAGYFENIYAAFADMEVFADLFSRYADRTMSPIEIADSLASSERSELLYSILNRLAGMDLDAYTENLLIFIAEFEKL